MDRMITLHVPEDSVMLAAFGEVALRHEYLNYILRMSIKTLARLSVEKAIDATAYDGSRQLRDRLRKLARQCLGEGESLLQLQALLERCRRATDKRNELMHGVWGKELDREPLRRASDHSGHPLPSVGKLKTL